MSVFTLKLMPSFAFHLAEALQVIRPGLYWPVHTQTDKWLTNSMQWDIAKCTNPFIFIHIQHWPLPISALSCLIKTPSPCGCVVMLGMVQAGCADIAKAWFRLQRRWLHASRISSSNMGRGAMNLKAYGNRAFSIVGPRLWNRLSNHVKDGKTVDILKKNLKPHFNIQSGVWYQLYFKMDLFTIVLWLHI